MISNFRDFSVEEKQTKKLPYLASRVSYGTRDPAVTYIFLFHVEINFKKHEYTKFPWIGVTWKTVKQCTFKCWGNLEQFFTFRLSTLVPSYPVIPCYPINIFIFHSKFHHNL